MGDENEVCAWRGSGEYSEFHAFVSKLMTIDMRKAKLELRFGSVILLNRRPIVTDRITRDD